VITRYRSEEHRMRGEMSAIAETETAISVAVSDD
jgi:hypothetical protein